MKRILIFIAITFGITYLYEFGVVYPLVNNAGQSLEAAAAAQLSLMGAMLMPSIGVVLTRLVTKEGFKDLLIKPRGFSRSARYFALAWFMPPFLISVGAAVFFLLNRGDFDASVLSSTSAIRDQLTAAGINPNQLPAGIIRWLPLIQIGLSILIAPILNFITCFGEEWGWRGYLLPRVNEHLSFIPTVLLTGVIWGLWHAPLTAIGHNYGLGYAGYPWLGILAMCCFCIVTGTFLSYVTLKTRSCLPAAIGHGALNGFAAAPLLFSVTGGSPFTGPLPVGYIGGSAFIFYALLLCWRMRNAKKWVWAPVNAAELAASAVAAAQSPPPAPAAPVAAAPAPMAAVPAAPLPAATAEWPEPSAAEQASGPAFPAPAAPPDSQAAVDWLADPPAAAPPAPASAAPPDAAPPAAASAAPPDAAPPAAWPELAAAPEPAPAEASAASPTPEPPAAASPEPTGILAPTEPLAPAEAPAPTDTPAPTEPLAPAAGAATANQNLADPFLPDDDEPPAGRHFSTSD